MRTVFNAIIKDYIEFESLMLGVLSFFGAAENGHRSVRDVGLVGSQWCLTASHLKPESTDVDGTGRTAVAPRASASLGRKERSGRREAAGWTNMCRSDDDDWATGGLGESAAEREAREVRRADLFFNRGHSSLSASVVGYSYDRF